MHNSFSCTSLPTPYSIQKPQSFSLASPPPEKIIKRTSLPKKTPFHYAEQFNHLLNPSKTKRPIKFPMKDSLLPLLPNMKVIIIFLTVSFFPLPFVPHQGLVNYTLRAKSCLPLLYVKKVLLKYSQLHYLE